MPHIELLRSDIILTSDSGNMVNQTKYLPIEWQNMTNKSTYGITDILSVLIKSMSKS